MASGLSPRSTRLLLIVAIGLAAGVAPTGTHASSPTPGPTLGPSAIALGEDIVGITVSPAYQRTGLVMVDTTPVGQCSKNCEHLWVSHNGGATWRRAKASNWGGGTPVIVLDGTSHEVAFVGSNAFERSDDGGETWHGVAGSGFPSPTPTFATDQTVVVATGGHDYAVDFRDRSARRITGSNYSLLDLGFMYSPTPSTGRYPSALLSAADRGTHAPIIEHCTADLVCSGSTTLAGAGEFAIPATLHPSSDFAEDGTVFARVGRGIYKSVDGGSTFAPVTIVSDGATTQATPMLALAPGYREDGPVRTAYAAILEAFETGQASHASGGIYRSIDGGATWARIGSPSPLDHGATAVAVAPDGRLFAGYAGSTGTGLLCSVDGAAWQTSCPSVGNGDSAATSGSGSGTSTGGASSACAAANACGQAGTSPSPGGGAANGASSASGPGATGSPTMATGAAVSPTSHRSVAILAAVLVLGVLLLTTVGVTVVRRRRSPPDPGTAERATTG